MCTRKIKQVVIYIDKNMNFQINDEPIIKQMS